MSMKNITIIVNNLRQENSCWNHCGRLIEDTRIIFKSLQSWVVGHVCREVNKAAHCLAEFTVGLLIEQVTEDRPLCIQNIKPSD